MLTGNISTWYKMGPKKEKGKKAGGKKGKKAKSPVAKTQDVYYW